MNKELADAVRVIASDVLADEDHNSDVAELLLVLARILEGKSVNQAFGAPGDWGYGTQIGNALAEHGK